MNVKDLSIKTIPSELFVLRYYSDTNIHKFDLLIRNDRIGDLPFIPSESELFILFYQKIYTTIDLDFEINECLSYHHNACENSERFLSIVRKAFIRQHLDYPATDYENHIHSMVMAWFDMMEKGPNHDIENLPEKISHKILLLHELGIIDHLSKEYFNSKQRLRTNTDLAKLIAVIINEPKSVENIRKAISGLGTGNNSDPIKNSAVKKVQNILSEYSLELSRIKVID